MSVSVAAARDTVRVGPVEIDRAPVTNARYAVFVEATGHRPPLYWPNGVFPESLADHPVVGVDFFDAAAFALWAGGSLPTELEWCDATGLKEHRAYVWGDGFDGARCNTVRHEARGTTPVGAFPDGVAPSGCVDMCGNVWEMTCTAYPDDDTAIVVKGGSWYDFPAHAKLDTQFRARVHKAGNTVGFRLIYGQPLRLPGFLDADLVAQCIEFRRGGGADEGEGGDEGAEFDTILSELRQEAAEHLPGLDLHEGPGIQLTNVHDALALFDAADADVAPELEPDPEASDHGPTLWDRVQDILARRPRTTFALLCIAIGAVLGVSLAASREKDHGFEAAERSAREDPEALRRRRPDSEQAPEAKEKAPRVAVKTRQRRTPLELAMHDLVSGNEDARESAERWLIWHADESYAKVREALKARLPAATRSSLRYVLAAIDERRATNPPAPEVIRDAPREGLVFFVDAVNGRVGDEITKARITAKAELVPLTVVLNDEQEAAGVLRTYKALFRDVRVFVDRDGKYARDLRITRQPALAGLGRNGRMAFLRFDRVGRSDLARKARSLRQ